jgi:hypothetical protein
MAVREIPVDHGEFEYKLSVDVTASDRTLWRRFSWRRYEISLGFNKKKKVVHTSRAFGLYLDKIDPSWYKDMTDPPNYYFMNSGEVTEFEAERMFAIKRHIMKRKSK